MDKKQITKIRRLRNGNDRFDTEEPFFKNTNIEYCKATLAKGNQIELPIGQFSYNDGMEFADMSFPFSISADGRECIQAPTSAGIEYHNGSIQDTEYVGRVKKRLYRKH